MPDERIESFLDQVCSHIRWPRYCARVRRELTDHILTRVEYLTSERGYTEANAVKQALRWLGDPDELGEALRRAYFPGFRFFWVFLTCVLWAGIAFCALYLFVHMRI